ncbi:MAG: putative glycoside hydrolase [Patescibacteria group bacterium]
MNKGRAKMILKKHFIKNLSIVCIFVGTSIVLFLLLPDDNFPQTSILNTNGAAVISDIINLQSEPKSEPKSAFMESPKPIHISTPPTVKAIYMTSWVAGTKDWRTQLADFVSKTELNAIVIDIKDYSGYVAFDTGDEFIKSVGAEEIRVEDLKEFIDYLHSREIYVIARITVFQDPVYAKKHLDQAVQKKDGALWKDRKGLSFVDPSSAQHREYIVRISRAAERVGFDELNFDYIRFPSDGNMQDIYFPLSGNRLKADVLEEFFRNIRQDLADIGIPLSADLFGMTMTNTDDLNIGQVLERTAPYFDYISPMVYPSHYPSGWNNFKNPAANPYEVVHIAMSAGAKRMLAASSTPAKLRPWLQDFDLGADYDAAKVRAQIKATYDSGLTSWMIWDSKNEYTRSAYELEN